MNVSGNFLFVVFVLLSAIVLVASVAFAIETLFIDNVEGFQLADEELCETDRNYFSDNETECDGFVYWNIFCLPPLFLLGLPWLIWGYYALTGKRTFNPMRPFRSDGE